MYKFKKIDKDTFELEYNGEKHTITIDLEKVVQLQQVDFEARVMMNKRLKEMNSSIEDLQYETKKDGKTTINDSQAQEALEICRKDAIYNKLKKIIKDSTNLDLLEIAKDLGEKDFQNFVTEFVIYMSGEGEKTPSK